MGTFPYPGDISAPHTQSFTVFGQAIITDANTVYDGVSGFSGLVQGDRVEVQGAVSNFVAGAGSSTFTVDDVNVSADNSLLSGVANGVEVEVKGTMSSGVLVAQSVRVDRDTNPVLGGTVGAVDATAGTVTVNGVTLAVTTTTIFMDASSAMVSSSSFSLANIMVGDYVGTSGYTDASVSPAIGVATRVVRLAPLSQAMIGGPVSAATTTSLTILGVSVDISGATFRDASGSPVASASAFVALITPGTTLAGALGTGNGSVFTATAAKIGELED